MVIFTNTVSSFWHGWVVHPLFPDTTNCINYTTEENFACTDSWSFIPVFFCPTFLRIPGMQSFLVFLWHLLNTLRFICKTSVPMWEVQKISSQSQEEPLWSSHPVFCWRGIIDKSMKELEMLTLIQAPFELNKEWFSYSL